ncbi:MAG: hypothetical protein NT103_07090 [Campylobacterales bacterium]|nr:hypothetical protein [Campylobacterales bacterium]
MKYVFKVWIIGCMVIFSAVYGYAGEAKGYKVVLASFPTFDGAKAKLTLLDTQLGVNERAIQEKYHYEIVARASGKAFIVAIEPLETKAITDQVIKQFHHLYPDAYSNGYFGPTEGAIVLEHAKTAPVVTEVNRSILQKVEKISEPKVMEVRSAPIEEKEKNVSFWIIIAGVIISIAVLFMMFKRRTPAQVSSSIENEKEILEVNSIEEVVPEEIELPAVIVPNPSQLEEAENDIFYRLKKNMFFITILKELKEAAESKDTSRCHDLMHEVLRYQKNFRKSNIITTMEELVESKNFSQLSAFVSNEIN